MAIIQLAADVALQMLDLCPDASLLGLQNTLGQAPLHLAVITRQPDIVRRLVGMGAPLEQRDRNGNSPLHLACREGDLTCVQALTLPLTTSEMAQAVYSVDVQCIPQNMDLWNYEGKTFFRGVFGKADTLAMRSSWGRGRGRESSCTTNCKFARCEKVHENCAAVRDKGSGCDAKFFLAAVLAQTKCIDHAPDQLLKDHCLTPFDIPGHGMCKLVMGFPKFKRSATLSHHKKCCWRVDS